MSVKGVNRVILAVRDMEKSKAYYADLLGAVFHEANWTGEPFGIQVSISWNAGIELCAPLPGMESQCAVTPFLDQYGEGVMNVVFDLEDADAAFQRAEATGAQTVNRVDYTQAEIDEHLDGLFSKYKEYFLDTAEKSGYMITLAQIEEKPG